AAEAGGQPRVVRARLVHVFVGDPDGIAIASGGAVVAPTRPISERAERMQTREALVWARTLRSHVKIPDADYGVDAGITRARIVIVTHHRKAHNAATALRDGNGRVSQVVARDAGVALLLHLAGVRVDHKIRDPGSGCGVSIDGEAGIERGPEFAIGQNHLLHPRIVAVNKLLGISKGSRSSDHQPPASEKSRGEL